jgi:hypothetical protein
MATKPTVAQVATGSKATATQWNNAVYQQWQFLDVVKPVCRLVQTVSSNFTTGTWTAVPMDTEIIDTDSQHSTVSNTSRVIIGNTLGWYRVSGVVYMNVTVAGKRTASGVAFNGAGLPLDGTPCIVYSDGVSLQGPASAVGYVQATLSTDYVELYGWQESGGTVASTVVSPYRSSLVVEYLGTLQ